MTEPATDLRAACRRAQQIGVLFVMSVAIYAYVLKLVAARHAPFAGFAPSVEIGLLRFVFALVAVAELAVLKVITPRMLERSAPFTAPARGASPVTQRLLAVSIVRLGICEAIAVFGLVLFLLGGRWADFVGFSAASLAAFAFPRLSQWEDWRRQAPA